MLVNTFNPFDNLLLSSLIAAIPIVLFLLCLTVFKMKGIYAAITTLVVTLLIAIPFFKLPVGIASGAVVEGFFQGIIPIGYIVMMAVLLYKITVEFKIVLQIFHKTNVFKFYLLDLHSTHF